ncbi:CcoQ/FixQ family Cbb3-type cytochrome c oxidase assembly chaperone [Jannaschia rubra]|uniref:Cbb3-type cytochrome oxidase, subunit 3 n=1 Tax=Jannaschia rubra TaxID=282197 RepID=A0A0M6XV20_9RHOB|nr:CcoQ/FixQ family Cbb3-type cytochrome c oxidase assembly chaperone [Jannaschia rubra]CTQ34618.1 Cbb3-type cytochrome oxidase, subunit 3 [Jannaschia rubra]SFG71806.1 cytochrome c oxidase cbb3-type subunit 4 [Jannaschia rubra]
METYTFLRQLADSWVLLALTLFFLGVVFWAFRPGSRALHDDAASVPFRDEEPQGGDERRADRTSDDTDMKGRSHG